MGAKSGGSTWDFIVNDGLGGILGTNVWKGEEPYVVGEISTEHKYVLISNHAWAVLDVIEKQKITQKDAVDSKKGRQGNLSSHCILKMYESPKKGLDVNR